MPICGEPPISVLHVDDEPNFANMTAAFLEREDERFSVRTATSANDGIAYLAEHDVDCIISDYDMPGQNGIEFLNAVREEFPNLPFILFTGGGSEEIASKAISAGVTDYLRKETGTDQYTVLATRIQNAVSNHRREQQLVCDKEWPEEILDVVDDIAFVLTEARHLVQWNDRFKEVTGYSDEEIESIQASDFVAEDDREKTANALQHVFETGSAWVQSQLVTKHGSSTPYELLTIRVEAPDGHPQLVVIGRDITELKERERERERYRVILNSINDGVYAIEPDGTIVYVNEAYASMKGVDRAELIGTDIYGWATESATERITAAREAVNADENNVGIVEYEFSTTDGDSLPVELRFATVSRSNNEIERVGLFRDISDRKARERALKQKNERLENFASFVSHDLRNPLNVANGYVDLLGTQYDDSYLDEVELALDRMDELITDLLELAREGNEVRDPTPFVFEDVTTDAWEAVETTDAILEVDPDLTDRSLRGDSGRVKNLLENLFRNSLEHGLEPDRDDPLTVRVGLLGSESSVSGVSTSEPGFYVEDDGCGLPDDEDVFETGYTTNEEGTGLGLPIVSEIATAHDWSIRATNRKDSGARFEITGVEFMD